MEFLLVKLPEEIEREEKLGNFKRAEKIIDRMLKKDIPNELRLRLLFEKERIKILIKTYPYNEDEAKKKAHEVINNFTDTEFYKLLDEGYLDYIVVEGEKRFEERFIQNVVFTLPEYKERVKEDKGKEEGRLFLQNRLNDLIKGNAKEFRIRARISLKLNEDVSGKVKVWLPFPKEEFQQKDVKLISTSHKNYYIAPNDVCQRTIYFEGDPKDKFFVEFEYTIHEWINKVDTSIVKDVDFKEFLSEEPPHIVFTNPLRKLAEEIVGNEKNPYLKAKKIYDWLTKNVNYSYVRPYITYENISEFVLSNLKGDCGFQAILLITLLRIVGVPARWQSGWHITPTSTSPHDWALFFVHPYGWLPVDPSFGGHFKDNEILKDFYFGNLDAVRMVANSCFMKDFVPKKTFYRIDPYDNQTGEVETDKGNCDFTYKIEVIDFKSI